MPIISSPAIRTKGGQDWWSAADTAELLPDAAVWRRFDVASLRPVTPRDDADAQVAAELAELEELAAALSAEAVEGLPPVQGPQDWT
jgi:hypothetical protein